MLGSIWFCQGEMAQVHLETTPELPFGVSRGTAPLAALLEAPAAPAARLGAVARKLGAKE